CLPATSPSWLRPAVTCPPALPNPQVALFWHNYPYQECNSRHNYTGIPVCAGSNMSKLVPDEEKALFRAAVANARPLKQRTRARRPAPPAAVPAQSRAEQQAVLRESLAPASEELALS